MEIINDADLKLDSLVNQAPTVVVVISASWCMPCKQLAIVIEEVSKDLSDVKFFKVDVTENVPAFVRDMGIRAVPTILVFKDGKQVNMASGSRSKNQLLELIQMTPSVE
jgi:thioredoxin 1